MFQFEPLSPRIRRLKEKREWYNTHMHLNTERTKIYTDYYKTHTNEYPVLKRAGAMNEWCSKCSTPIEDDDVLVGALGPETRTLNFYVEWNAEWIDRAVNDSDENFRLAWQAPGAVRMEDYQRKDLKEAAAFWWDQTISAKTSGIIPPELLAVGANGANNFGTFGGRFRGAGSPQGHYIANFNRAVNIGFGEIRREAQNRLDKLYSRTFGNAARSHAFYRGVIRVCDGAMTLSKRYAAACRDKANGTADVIRKNELLKMADSLDWIMEHPARSYWEALEIMLLYEIMIVTDCQQHGQSIANVDRYAGHILDRELAEGKITLEQAQEYTDAFVLRIGDLLCMPGGAPNSAIIGFNQSGKNLYFSHLGQFMTYTSGIHITVAGQDRYGNDINNEVTRLFLKSYGRLNVPDPTVAVRIHKNTSSEVWQLAVESSKISGGMPQFQNDDVIIPMLLRRGLSIEDAREYGIVGCVEPAGSGNEWAACGNDGSNSIWCSTGIIPLVINGGKNPISGDGDLPCKMLYEYESFDELKQEFERQCRHSIDWHVTACNFYEQAYSENFPSIVASTMMEGCLEKGLDATWGGSKYNSTGMTCMGIANTADSLMAIKKLCFDEKTVSTRTMFDALKADWVGYEDLRQTIVNDVPHYGNDNAEVDELASWAMRIFAEHLQTCEGPRGKYCGGTFTMIAHIGGGMHLGATPDGRKHGDPLADAISPRQGFDKNGPTAYLRSAAKLPHEELWNGDQLNIRFSPTSVSDDEGTIKLQKLIETYFDLGGMQVQFNVVGTEKLREAQRDPENNKDLIIRIAGFSTYFVTLNTDVQNDFITRTEQSV